MSRNENPPARGDEDGNWRKGGGGGSFKDSGSRGGDDKVGAGWRGGSGGGGSGGSRFPSSEGPSASSGGQRPRLNLKARGAGASGAGGAGASSAADTGETKLSKISLKENSRAAAFGSAPEVQSQALRPREGRVDRGAGQNRGPPPVANQRMAQMADEERANNRERETQRADRGPPEAIGSSRFAMPPGEERRAPREPQGPPPVANSRFAAAAAMAKQEGDQERDRGGGGDRFGGGGGASRFSDRDGPGGGGSRFSDRGPPPQQNSRFAAAAAADPEYGQSREDRGGGGGGDRFGGGGRDGGGGGDRFGGGGRDRGGGGDRFGGGGRDRDDRGGGGYGRDRDSRGGGYGGGSGSMNDLPRGPRSQMMDDLPREPRSMGEDGPRLSRVDDLKPKISTAADNLLAPKAAPVHEQNMLQFPAKAFKKDDDANILMAPSKKSEEKPSKPEPKVPAAPVVDTEKANELLAEFASGNKLGEDLKAWVVENRASLPTIDQLVFKMLEQQEKLNPDPECGWADPAKFGAALLALVEDDIVGQMQVLWGIQFYCDSIGFPKLDDVYIAQAMFRGTYKFDLVEDDAFIEWKDDETEACEKGKLKAIIQTMEWFNWLAEADESEGEEEEGEEEVEE